jgi:hypothetical protein
MLLMFTSCAAAIVTPGDLRQKLRVGRATAAVANLHLDAADRHCIAAVAIFFWRLQVQKVQISSVRACVRQAHGWSHTTTMNRYPAHC